MINLLRVRGGIFHFWKTALILVIVLLSVIGINLLKTYRYIYAPNIDLGTEETALFYIYKDALIDEVVDSLLQKGWIKNEKSLHWVMEKKNYAKHVYPGRYKIPNGISNNELVNLLRSGIQVPLDLTFNNSRTVKELAGKIARQIELDSLSLLKYFDDTEFLSEFGFTPATIISMFIPNTYEIYWNISAEGLFNRMHNEYLRFWNTERLKKAEKINLSPMEVSILASIVDAETNKADEKSVLAGVYINRLKKRIRLQADPTLKFALNDFTIRRILNNHKEIDSPYNTYKHYGLPPGPISQPSIAGVDAVLNYQEHNYLYFCAKADFSGYHVFARTLNEHLRNARKYQKALNRERIYH